MFGWFTGYSSEPLIRGLTYCPASAIVEHPPGEELAAPSGEADGDQQSDRPQKVPRLHVSRARGHPGRAHHTAGTEWTG